MSKKTEQQTEFFSGEKKERGLMFYLFLKFVGWAVTSISGVFQFLRKNEKENVEGLPISTKHSFVELIPLKQRFTEKKWEEEYESSREDAESSDEEFSPVDDDDLKRHVGQKSINLSNLSFEQILQHKDDYDDQVRDSKHTL